MFLCFFSTNKFFIEFNFHVIFKINVIFISNNTLKIIACISMFIDHLGFMIFPTNITLRIIGRIAFPIFAYMLAEGAIYTKNKVKHLGILAILAVVIQVFMYFFADFKDFSIFIHFSLSLVLIYLLDCFERKTIYIFPN